MAPTIILVSAYVADFKLKQLEMRSPNLRRTALVI